MSNNSHLPSLYSNEVLNMLYCEYEQKFEYAPLKSKEELIKVLKKRTKDGFIKKWAYILHDKDIYVESDTNIPEGKSVGDNKDEHFHIVMELSSNQKPNVIAKWFKDEKPERIQKAKTTNKKFIFFNMVEYLFHETPSSINVKAHYEHSEAIANFNIEKFLEKGRQESNEYKKKINSKNEKVKEKELLKQLEDDIVEAIKQGTPPYKISKLFFSGDNLKYADRFKTKINAWYETYCEAHPCAERQGLLTTWVMGPSGSGKNTLARNYAYQEYSPEDVCEMDCTQQNAWDKYEGQPCIILQDFRTYHNFYAQLLNLIDWNASTEAQARYHNKDCRNIKRVYITNTLDLDELCIKSDDYKVSDGELFQLQRRVQLKVKIELVEKTGQRKVSDYKFNESKKEYEFVSSHLLSYDPDKKDKKDLDLIILRRKFFPIKNPELLTEEQQELFLKMKKELPEKTFSKIAELHNCKFEMKNELVDITKNLSEDKKEEIKNGCQRLMEIEYGLPEDNPFVFVPIAY